MLGIEQHRFGVATASSAEDPVADRKPGYAGADLEYFTGTFHTHDKGQLLTGISAPTHTSFRKIDTRGVDFHQYLARPSSQLTKLFPDHSPRIAEFLDPKAARQLLPRFSPFLLSMCGAIVLAVALFLLLRV